MISHFFIKDLSGIKKSARIERIKNLPPICDSISGGRRILNSNDDLYVILDFPAEAEEFGYLNYKSLESFLYALPNANFVIHIIGPAAANYYQFKGLLSKHTFQKYIKYGFKLRVDIVDDIILYRLRNTLRTGIPLETKESVSRLSLSYPGYHYAKLAMRTCCEHKKAKDIEKGMKVPLHLHFFNRVVLLYEYGGISSDFSWIHLNVINRESFISSAFTSHSSVNGYIWKTICFLNDHKEECTTSSLLAFSRKNPILRCLLRYYNSEINVLPKRVGKYQEESFLSCIEMDQRTGGAVCIERALQACFDDNKATNLFDSGDTFRSLQLTSRNKSQLQSCTSTDCVRPPNDTDSAIKYSSFLFDNLQGKETSGICLATDGLLWLGANSHRSTWQRPAEFSLLARLLEETSPPNMNLPSLNAASTPRQRKIRQCFREAELHPSSPCNHYYSDPLSNSTTVAIRHKQQAQLSCAPKFVLAG